MDVNYVLTAKRVLDGPSGLNIEYPTKEHAIAAAEIVRHSWSIVMITAPDGSLIAQFEETEA